MKAWCQGLLLIVWVGSGLLAQAESRDTPSGASTPAPLPTTAVSDLPLRESSASQDVAPVVMQTGTENATAAAMLDESVDGTRAAPTEPMPALPAGSTAATESIEAQLAELERDLAILEEDLLYPPSSRIAVYLSLDVGELFDLDEVELKLNGETVAHHLYTARQVGALARGGVQRLYVGNARQGDNELTAFFLGRAADGRAIRRATSARFVKQFEPLLLELAINDDEQAQRPAFSVQVR